MFKSYLKQSKSLIESVNLQKGDLVQKRLKFVIGNETSDMDSIFSSLVYGYIKSIFSQKQNEQAHYIPIINSFSSDIHARFETIYLLKNLDLETGDLVYLDSFNLKDFVLESKPEIILVDHNIPSTVTSYLKDFVTEIVDHHEDRTDITFPQGQIKRKKIEKIGSTTTLVFEELWAYWDEVKSEVGVDVLWLLLCTILTDTFNLNPKEKDIRWVEKDVWAKTKICSLLKDAKEFPQWRDESGEINCNLVFDTLSSLKFDPDMNLKLGMEQLFLKDYKAFTYNNQRVGYSVFMINFEDLLIAYSLEEVQAKIKEFQEKEGLDILIGLFVHPKSKENPQDLKRQVVVFSHNEEIIPKMKKYLLQQKSELSEVNLGLDEKHFCHLLDVNSVYSRKILEPLIAKFMSDV